MRNPMFWLPLLSLGALTLAACNPTPESAPDDTNIAASAPSATMHPSWDADNNGINDCETNGSCDHTIDYTKPRPAPVTTPAFDCTKATAGSIEQLICEDPILAQLDQTLANVYSEATAKAIGDNSPLLKTEQVGWIKGRDDCWKSDDKFNCIKTEYERRITELQARHALVNAIGPVRFSCGETAADDLLVTFYQSNIPSLIATRGDTSSLMFLVTAASGSKYEGRNESFWEHQGEARVVWGYEAPELVCKKTE